MISDYLSVGIPTQRRQGKGHWASRRSSLQFVPTRKPSSDPVVQHDAADQGGACLHSLPAAARERLATHPISRALYFTEVGWAPRAAGQAVEREHGLPEQVLLFCVRGMGSLEVGGVRHELMAGQAALIPADTAHRYAASSRQPWSLFSLHFTGSDSEYYLRTLAESVCAIPVESRTAQAVGKLCRQMCELFDGGAVESRLIHGCQLLRVILSHLLCDNPAFKRTPAPPRHPGVDSALGYMQTVFGRTLNLTEIARHAGLSVSHCCALFREHLGVSPMDYLIHLRLQKACDLLLTTPLTIGEVAQRVGYEDRYYFSRLFRKLQGMPPVEFRKAQRTSS